MALTTKQISFLSEYRPADDMFTSGEEVEKIESIFIDSDFAGLTIDAQRSMLRDMRNEVVKFYSGKMGNDRASIDRYMPSLQSVTAVIDHAKWQVGAEV